MEKLKVLVVDDQAIARGYFEGLIRASQRYELAASFSSAEAACVYCAGNPIDLAILDVVLRHGMDGLEAAQALKKAHPKLKVLIATTMPESSFLDRARAIGVDGFWYKEYSDEPLLEAMDAAIEGRGHIPQAAPVVMLGLARNDMFTAQELAVLRQVATGAGNSQIAHELGVSIHTVRTHVKHLLEKTGYATRTQLAVNASLAGLVVPDDAF